MTLGVLHFGLPLPGSLRFGGDEVGTEVAFAAVLPVPIADFHFLASDYPPVELAFAADLPVPLADFSGLYDINVFRGPALQVNAYHQDAVLATSAVRVGWRPSLSSPSGKVLPWQDGAGQPSGLCIRSTNAVPPATLRGWQMPWRKTVGTPGDYLGFAISSDFPTLIHPGRIMPWQEATKTVIGRRTAYEFPIMTPVWRAVIWDESEATWMAFDRRMGWGEGAIFRPVWRIPWQEARPAWCFWTRWVRPPAIVPPPNLGVLSFRCRFPGELSFTTRCFGSAQTFPRIRRSYRVINTVALTRLSNGADIPVSAITIGIDWDSWAWTLSATLLGAGSVATLGSPPTEVKVVINGFEWRFVVDTIEQSRAFATFSANISGRSLAAWLAEPYFKPADYTEGQNMTAEQLALQELPENAGWTLDWQLPMWTVPAYRFIYQNLTPIAVIQRITASAGGMLQAAMADKALTARPKWPIKPWDWVNTTADLTLPSAYVWKEGAKLQRGIDPNSVMVCGSQTGGLVAQATIAGTAGDAHAPLVVDNLITDLEPAMAKAIQALADLWTVRTYTVELPLQAIPQGSGLVLPGTIIDLDEVGDGWRGLVTGTSISAGRNSVTQTLEVVGNG